MNRRQHLFAEARVRDSFVPAHSNNRPVILPARVSAELPAGRPRSTGRVDEELACLRPRQLLRAILELQVLPVLFIVVTARVDELLELAIGHLGARDSERGNVAAIAAEQ